MKVNLYLLTRISKDKIDVNIDIMSAFIFLIMVFYLYLFKQELLTIDCS